MIKRFRGVDFQSDLFNKISSAAAVSEEDY